MNFAHSKTNSLLNLACKLLGGFQASNPEPSVCGPKVCGMLVYKLTTSKVANKVSS